MIRHKAPSNNDTAGRAYDVVDKFLWIRGAPIYGVWLLKIVMHESEIFGESFPVRGFTCAWNAGYQEQIRLRHE